MTEIRCLFSPGVSAFILEVINLIVLFAIFVSLPFFTYRDGYSTIPIYIAVVFAITVVVYMFVIKNLRVTSWMLVYLVYMVYGSILTALLTQDWSTFKTFLSVSLMSLLIFEFLALSGFTKFGCYLYCFAGVIFSAALLIDSLDTLPGRIGETFGNINSVAFYLVTVVTACLVAQRVTKNRWGYLFLLPSIGASILVMFTGSRFGIIAIGLLYVVYLFLVCSRRWYIALGICTGLVILSLIFFFALPGLTINVRIKEMFDTLLGKGNYDGSTATRINMYKDGLNLFAKNAIFGYGMGGFCANTSYLTYSHSTIIELLCSFGLIGTSLFFLTGYLALKDVKIKGIAWLFVAIVVPAMLFSVLYYDKYFLSFFPLLASFSVQEKPMYQTERKRIAG